MYAAVAPLAHRFQSIQGGFEILPSSRILEIIVQSLGAGRARRGPIEFPDRFQHRNQSGVEARRRIDGLEVLLSETRPEFGRGEIQVVRAFDVVGGKAVDQEIRSIEFVELGKAPNGDIGIDPRKAEIQDLEAPIGELRVQDSLELSRIGILFRNPPPHCHRIADDSDTKDARGGGGIGLGPADTPGVGAVEDIPVYPKGIGASELIQLLQLGQVGIGRLWGKGRWGTIWARQPSRDFSEAQNQREAGQKQGDPCSPRG